MKLLAILGACLAVGSLLAAAAISNSSGRDDAADESACAPSTQPVDLAYVMSPTCLKCKETTPVVHAAAERHKGRIRLRMLNVQDGDDLETVLELEERHKAPAAPPPRVFVGRRCLTGVEEITGQLDAAIAESLAPASQPDSQPGR